MNVDSEKVMNAIINHKLIGFTDKNTVRCVKTGQVKEFPVIQLHVGLREPFHTPKVCLSAEDSLFAFFFADLVKRLEGKNVVINKDLTWEHSDDRIELSMRLAFIPKGYEVCYDVVEV